MVAVLLLRIVSDPGSCTILADVLALSFHACTTKENGALENR